MNYTRVLLDSMRGPDGNYNSRLMAQQYNNMYGGGSSKRIDRFVTNNNATPSIPTGPIEILPTALDLIRTDIDNLEVRIASIEDSDATEQEITNLQSQLTALESQFTDLQTQTSGQDDDISTLTTDIETLNSALNSLAAIKQDIIDNSNKLPLENVELGTSSLRFIDSTRLLSTDLDAKQEIINVDNKLPITNIDLETSSLSYVDITSSLTTQLTAMNGFIATLTGLQEGDVESFQTQGDSIISLQTQITAQDAAITLKAPLASPAFTGTVSGISKSMVGLGDVNNTTDANKPISSATSTALDLKASLASPAFTGTVTGISKSMVGLGDADNTADADKPISSATSTALDLKAPLANPVFTGTVSGVSKSMIDGIDLVDNTSDIDKPISTAQQAALDEINLDVEALQVAVVYRTQTMKDDFLGSSFALGAGVTIQSAGGITWKNHSDGAGLSSITTVSSPVRNHPGIINLQCESSAGEEARATLGFSESTLSWLNADSCSWYVQIPEVNITGTAFRCGVVTDNAFTDGAFFRLDLDSSEMTVNVYNSGTNINYSIPIDYSIVVNEWTRFAITLIDDGTCRFECGPESGSIVSIDYPHGTEFAYWAVSPMIDLSTTRQSLPTIISCDAMELGYKRRLTIPNYQPIGQTQYTLSSGFGDELTALPSSINITQSARGLACSDTGQYIVCGVSSHNNSTYGTKGIWVSNNYGDSFTHFYKDEFIEKSASSGDGKYMIATRADANDDPPYISTDYGVTWNEIASSSWPVMTDDQTSGCCISEDGQYMVIGTYYVSDGGISYSNDYGVSWTKVYTDPHERHENAVCSSSGQYVMMMGRNKHKSVDQVRLTNDYGLSWFMANTLNSCSLGGISASGAYMYLASDNHKFLYTSTDFGTTWVESSLTMTGALCGIATFGTGANVIITTFSSDIVYSYVSDDYGTSWTEQSATNGITITSSSVGQSVLTTSQDGKYTFLSPYGTANLHRNIATLTVNEPL